MQLNDAFRARWLARSIFHLEAGDKKSHVKSLISDQFLVYCKK